MGSDAPAGGTPKRIGFIWVFLGVYVAMSLLAKLHADAPDGRGINEDRWPIFISPILATGIIVYCLCQWRREGPNDSVWIGIALTCAMCFLNTVYYRQFV